MPEREYEIPSDQRLALVADPADVEAQVQTERYRHAVEDAAVEEAAATPEP